MTKDEISKIETIIDNHAITAQEVTKLLEELSPLFDDKNIDSLMYDIREHVNRVPKLIKPEALYEVPQGETIGKLVYFEEKESERYWYYRQAECAIVVLKGSEDVWEKACDDCVNKGNKDECEACQYDKCRYINARRGKHNQDDTVVELMRGDITYKFKKDDYMKTWRCWTRKPLGSHMEATPWG